MSPLLSRHNPARPHSVTTLAPAGSFCCSQEWPAQTSLSLASPGPASWGGTHQEGRRQTAAPGTTLKKGVSEFDAVGRDRLACVLRACGYFGLRIGHRLRSDPALHRGSPGVDSTADSGLGWRTTDWRTSIRRRSSPSGPSRTGAVPLRQWTGLRTIFSAAGSPPQLSFRLPFSSPVPR